MVSFLRMGSGTLSVTSILLVNTGMIRSSPSVKRFAFAATLKVTALTPSGTERFQASGALPPFFTVKATCGAAFLKAASIGCMVTASKRKSCAVPVRALSERFDTFAVKVIRSFSRKNRGGLGMTISSFRVTRLLVTWPYCRSFVWANPIMFQRVSASGIVKLTMTSPFSFVVRPG